jgi:exodeoxyribonuclease VII large subunit
MLLGHLAQRLDDLQERIVLAMNARIDRYSDRLSSARNHLRLTSPAVRLERNRETLISLVARGENGVRRALDRNREAAAVNAGKLQALSPLKTLERGYAVVSLLPDGNVVRESGQVAPGDRLDLKFARGGAVCIVDSTHD